MNTSDLVSYIPYIYQMQSDPNINVLFQWSHVNFNVDLALARMFNSKCCVDLAVPEDSLIPDIE